MAAARLRFRAAPRTDVRFSGSSGRPGISRARRSNLPAPVRTAEIYRDVRVAYVLAHRLGATDDDGEGA
ncbi:hypothetical protein [Streptomyces sp. NPDC048639]|uniref:hypothetical protein n=1 Tax=Streptomyces sp. NPDC048639 TaxID=3365581 RepID=UPI003718C7D2